MTTDFKNRVSRKKRLNFYIQITREKKFFLTYIESSIAAPYSKEYSRHIVLLNRQRKLIFWNFETHLNSFLVPVHSSTKFELDTSKFARVSQFTEIFQKFKISKNLKALFLDGYIIIACCLGRWLKFHES